MTAKTQIALVLDGLNLSCWQRDALADLAGDFEVRLLFSCPPETGVSHTARVFAALSALWTIGVCLGLALACWGVGSTGG